MDAKAMAVIEKNSDRFQEVVRQAAAQLVSHEFTSGSNYVTTPLMYASGGFVVVRIEAASDHYLVSDFGTGFEEAQMIGEEMAFRRVAKGVAETCGVGFDSYSLFSLKVNAGQLAGAIATIANASQEAVNITTIKASERKIRDDNALLFDRLSKVFGAKSIARDVHIIGASNTEWHVSSLVTVVRSKIAFEAVSKHPTSVVHAAAKFGDIARSEQAPQRVAVVASKKALGTYLGVLTHNARVIERRVDDRVYLSLSEAA